MLVSFRDPNLQVKVARVHNNGIAQLVSTTLITTGTRIVAVGVANLTNTATYVHFCDEAAATGNISVTSFAAIGVPASDTAYVDLPAPYVASAGCTVKAALSNTTSFIYYEA